MLAFFRAFNSLKPKLLVCKEFDNSKYCIFNKKCKVTILDTGLTTLTGGRLKKAAKYLKNNEDFMFTYGDGISDVNLKKLVDFHKKHGKIATVTAVRPPARFGVMKLADDNGVVFGGVASTDVTKASRVNEDTEGRQFTEVSGLIEPVEPAEPRRTSKVSRVSRLFLTFSCLLFSVSAEAQRQKRQK